LFFYFLALGSFAEPCESEQTTTARAFILKFLLSLFLDLHQSQPQQATAYVGYVKRNILNEKAAAAERKINKFSLSGIFLLIVSSRFNLREEKTQNFFCSDFLSSSSSSTRVTIELINISCTHSAI
jgi:hypothetical protein